MNSSSSLIDLFDPGGWHVDSSTQHPVRRAIDPSLGSSHLYVHHTASHGFRGISWVEKNFSFP